MPSPDGAQRRFPEGGEAWFELPADRCVGRVLASFRRATYIEIGDAVLALTDRHVPSGPIHLSLQALPPTATGAPVVLERRTLTIGNRLLGLHDLARWRPPAIDPWALVSVAPAAVEQLDRADRSELAQDPATDAARAALADGELPAVVGCLAGRGGGLTPAGDDVLAGILVVLALAGCDREHLAGAANTARTHPIAHAFVTWAARGQSVEPAHRLLAALAAGDQRATDRYQEQVSALGHTSGSDLLLGLRLALFGLTSLVLGPT